MRTVTLRLPSPALIVASLALFAALGGGSYAATTSGGSSIHWTNAKLKNGWQAWPKSAGVAYPGYTKDSLGFVHLRGEVRHGTNYSVAFVLPRGLRPRHTLYLDAVGGGSQVILGIAPNGQVTVGGLYATSSTSLDGVSFAAGE